MDNMEKLYQEYGILMIKLEILQNQVAQVKQKIAEKLSCPAEEKTNDKQLQEN